MHSFATEWSECNRNNHYAVHDTTTHTNSVLADGAQAAARVDISALIASLPIIGIIISIIILPIISGIISGLLILIK